MTETSINALLLNEPQRKPAPKRKPELERKPEPKRKLLQHKARTDHPKAKKKRAPRRPPGPIELDQHLLLKEQVLKLCGNLGYSTLWGYMKNAGFPHPIALGKVDGRTTKCAWIASKVYAWLAARPRRPIGELKEIREAQVDPAKRRKPKKAVA